MTPWLRALADLCTLLAAVALCVFVGFRLFDGREAGRADGYTPGELMDKLPGIRYDDAPTLVVFLATRCNYCLDSVTFYRSLTRVRRDAHMPFRMVVAGMEPETSLRSFVEENGLEVDQIVTLVSLASVRVRGTPTLVFVDQKGRTVNSWVGRLTPGLEREVQATVLGVRRNRVAGSE